MSRPGPALLRLHPALARLPRRPYLAGPTPVEPLALEGIPAGLVWVKRDEACCPLYGGNKPRKLEFVIGAALARGARRLLTTGALGTHHGLATTILGRAAGLATTLVLVDQPLSPEVRESLQLFAAYGAELRYGRGLVGAARECAAALACSLPRRERIHWVPTGGSGATGNVGLVAAGYELAEQVRAGELPEPASIYVAVGSGGTQAGLLLGIRLAGLASRVIGVLVNDILPPTPRSQLRAARATLRHLHRADPSIPALKLSAADFPLLGSQLGAGYGAPTRAAEAARVRAREAGLALETTYTAKCFAEILALAERKPRDGVPILFWNTFNSIDVRSLAPRVPTPEALAPALRRAAGFDSQACESQGLDARDGKS